jgi:uncharacterized protein (DUF362 family)
MQTVGVVVTLPMYCSEPPYHPDTAFPELPFRETSASANRPYALLRKILHEMGCDTARYGTAEWNPLGHVVSPGNTVVLKPNFIGHWNRMEGEDVFAVVTHPSILRVLVDYVYLALRGNGRIIIADCPQMDCDWEALMRIQRLDAVQQFYREKFHFEVEVRDLRKFRLIDPEERAYSHNRQPLDGDPLGSSIINLGRQSEFYGLPSENYYGADYDRKETIRHHQGDTHEYCVSRTVLSADTVISVPKMKVHKKVGVTLNLKGLVGINTDKNYLVHYRLGSPSEGGDQLPDSLGRRNRLIVRVNNWLYDHLMARQTLWADKFYGAIRRVYQGTLGKAGSSRATHKLTAGSWHGNDSAWRMTADLGRILLYGQPDGTLGRGSPRKLFCVVDGIVGGEGEGPTETHAKPCGCLVAGESPHAVDMVAARLMGFDIQRLKQFSPALAGKMDVAFRSLDEIRVVFEGQEIGGGKFFDLRWSSDPMFGFRPPSGWIGHIEIDPLKNGVAGGPVGHAVAEAHGGLARG